MFVPLIDRIKQGKFLPAPLITESAYKCNSNNYRAPEFDTVDWANSVVIFGCSNVFGTGLDQEHTISSQLSRLINMPVINMGVASTSMEYSFYNSMILNQNYPTPRAIVQAWTSYERTSYYRDSDVFNHGPWTWGSKEKFMQAYSESESHAATHAIMMQMISQQIWRPKTKYFELSVFAGTAQLLGIHRPRLLDKAADGSHPGPATVSIVSQTIRQELGL